MDSFDNIKEEYQNVRKEIIEVVEEIRTATGDSKALSKLLLFQGRLRELNRKIDYHSDKARRVREKGDLGSSSYTLVKNIQDDRLRIARSLNEIDSYIEHQLVLQEDACNPKIERVINQPRLKFPEFEEDSLLYLKFKNEFCKVMGFMSLSDDIKQIYLWQSLKGHALACVGGAYNTTTYEEMWKCLDERYNNKWSLCIDSLTDFFSTPKPRNEDDPCEIEHYWDTIINKLNYILSLEISTEQILIHSFLYSLPNPFKGDFVRRLPSPLKIPSIDEANDIYYKVIKYVPSGNSEESQIESSTKHSDDQKESDSEDEKGEFPFPEFHGDMSNYNSFKNRFSNIGDIYGMNSKMKLHFLKLSLKNDALRYIGSWGSHHESYESMWKYLDKRYNDLWMVSNKKVNNFFQIKTPEYEQEKIRKYWHSGISEIISMMALELNIEKIFIIYIIQSLPRQFKFEFVKKLQCKEQDKKAYEINEASNSFNELIADWKLGYISNDSNRKYHGYKANGKFHGNNRGRGTARGRAWKRFD